VISAAHVALVGAAVTFRSPSRSTCPRLEIAGASPGVGVTTSVGGVTVVVSSGLGVGIASSSSLPDLPSRNPNNTPTTNSTAVPAISVVLGGRSRPGALLRCRRAVTTPADLRAAAFLKVVTWARVALVPVILALILAGPDNDTAFTIAAVLFAVAALTDFFDGLLARRWAQTSVFGNFLDTTADKLLVAGALIGLLVVGRVSPWIAVIIIGREILIIGLKGAVASTGDLVQPSVWGKAKANVQFLAIFLAILRPGEPIGPLYLDQWAMIAAAVITVLSGLEYVLRFRGAITTGRDPAA
jgi:CDP-diacylglycerol--glycerol-3-phosphate 3-phosphatidyltransferase